MTGGNVRMQIVVAPELHTFLDERCELLHMSMNSMVSMLIRKEMERIAVAEQRARMERREQAK